MKFSVDFLNGIYYFLVDCFPIETILDFKQRFSVLHHRSSDKYIMCVKVLKILAVWIWLEINKFWIKIFEKLSNIYAFEILRFLLFSLNYQFFRELFSYLHIGLHYLYCSVFLLLFFFNEIIIICGHIFIFICSNFLSDLVCKLKGLRNLAYFVSQCKSSHNIVSGL